MIRFYGYKGSNQWVQISFFKYLYLKEFGYVARCKFFGRSVEEDIKNLILKDK